LKAYLLSYLFCDNENVSLAFTLITMWKIVFWMLCLYAMCPWH